MLVLEYFDEGQFFYRCFNQGLVTLEAQGEEVGELIAIKIDRVSWGGVQVVTIG